MRYEQIYHSSVANSTSNMIPFIDLLKELFSLGEYSADRLLGGMRASDWPQFRKIHIKNACEFCGTKGTVLSPLELHHVLPFHLYENLELDHTNVVTGCRSCHLKFYHLGSFRSFNEQIKDHIKLFANLIKNRP